MSTSRRSDITPPHLAADKVRGVYKQSQYWRVILRSSSPPARLCARAGEGNVLARHEALNGRVLRKASESAGHR